MLLTESAPTYAIGLYEINQFQGLFLVDLPEEGYYYGVERPVVVRGFYLSGFRTGQGIIYACETETNCVLDGARASIRYLDPRGSTGGRQGLTSASAGRTRGQINLTRDYTASLSYSLKCLTQLTVPINQSNLADPKIPSNFYSLIYFLFRFFFLITFTHFASRVFPLSICVQKKKKKNCQTTLILSSSLFIFRYIDEDDGLRKIFGGQVKGMIDAVGFEATTS